MKWWTALVEWWLWRRNVRRTLSSLDAYCADLYEIAECHRDQLKSTQDQVDDLREVQSRHTDRFEEFRNSLASLRGKGEPYFARAKEPKDPHRKKRRKQDK